MDYESKIVLATELPFLLSFAALVVEKLGPWEKSALFRRCLSWAGFAITTALVAGFFLGNFGWFTSHVGLPEKVSREVAFACFAAQMFYFTLSRTRNDTGATCGERSVR